MINKNFNDIARLAAAIKEVADEFKEDAIKFDLKDIEINLTVSETELSIIDRDLYELTKGNSDKEYTPGKAVRANVGGVPFVITTKDRD